MIKKHLYNFFQDWHCVHAPDGNGEVQTISSQLSSPGTGMNQQTRQIRYRMLPLIGSKNKGKLDTIWSNHIVS